MDLMFSENGNYQVGPIASQIIFAFIRCPHPGNDPDDLCHVVRSFLHRKMIELLFRKDRISAFDRFLLVHPITLKPAAYKYYAPRFLLFLDTLTPNSLRVSGLCVSDESNEFTKEENAVFRDALLESMTPFQLRAIKAFLLAHFEHCDEEEYRSEYKVPCDCKEFWLSYFNIDE